MGHELIGVKPEIVILTKDAGCSNTFPFWNGCGGIVGFFIAIINNIHYNLVAGGTVSKEWFAES